MELTRDAILSKDAIHRYQLSRLWQHGNGQLVGFICCNPSTADALVDDPTVKKCVRFANRWGFSGVMLANLFALRATNPKVMYRSRDPVGPENDLWINKTVDICAVVVAAWGCGGTLLGRNDVVRERYNGRLSTLSTTKGGHPSHPLYLRETLTPVPFR